MEAETIATGCKALGHPARVQILRLLAAQTECRGADVFGELPLAQSTISEHLRVLKEAGLVSTKSVGTGTVYCLVHKTLDALAAELSKVARAQAACR